MKISIGKYTSTERWNNGSTLSSISGSYTKYFNHWLYMGIGIGLYTSSNFTWIDSTANYNMFHFLAGIDIFSARLFHLNFDAKTSIPMGIGIRGGYDTGVGISINW